MLHAKKLPKWLAAVSTIAIAKMFPVYQFKIVLVFFLL